MASATEIRDLTKSCSDVRTLGGVNLDIPEGSFFGLLRSGGAGKTTLINILVGLVRRIGGEASTFGYDVEDGYREARDHIGLVPQKLNVDRSFPIRGMFEYKAGHHRIPYDEVVERADEMLKRVGIYDRRDTRFNWLPGGMKYRSMLARALITNPNLLILDESTTGVDVQLRHKPWETIAGLNDGGTTTLFTAHYIEETERLYDEATILDSGLVIEVASPEELMDRGTDDIVVQLHDPPTTAPDFAADNDRVEVVEPDGIHPVMMAQQGGLVVPDMVQALDRRGHELVSLETSRTSLEEMFVKMTRQGEGRTTARVEQ